MSTPILATKLYVPLPRLGHIWRSRLIERLNEGMHHKLTLVSAPAGFGKTTLVSSWIDKFHANAARDDQTVSPIAWLSLDEGDNELTRFLTYFVAALQTLPLSGVNGATPTTAPTTASTIGQGMLEVLQSPQPPIESLLTGLLNEIAAIPERFILVLDDYHLIDAQPVDHALAFLVEHMPPSMHLVITTREDPALPLARYRARGELTELRAADLRFTSVEAAGFLSAVAGLSLSAEEVAALESRTEGWVAGLQMAALSMQGHKDVASFIDSFTGSHHFIMDYLVEEVLNQQPPTVQAFLLHTSILGRFCGPLCDAVLQSSVGSGQETLAQVEQANLFLIPLDNERRWYRYHHLFADLLQQRLQKRAASSIQDTSSPANKEWTIGELHSRASVWFEENGLEVEAFQHAGAAHDIDRAGRLAEGGGMPLLFRGAVAPVVTWLESLPRAELDARPSLWVMYASALLFVGQISRVEETLQLAEAALEKVTETAKTRDDIGHIATIRATLAVPQMDAEMISVHSRRALDYLHPDNLPVRTATLWTLGFAHQLQGNRAAAKESYREAIANSEALGHFIIQISATTGLANILELENQLRPASEAYEHVLQIAGDRPSPAVFEAHLGLARIYYEWNQLALAQEQAELSARLSRPIEGFPTFARATALLAQLQLVRGNVESAVTLLSQAEQFMQPQGAWQSVPEIVTTKIQLLLQQGNLDAAAQLAESLELPLSQARVHLANGEPAVALDLLEPFHQAMAAKEWADEQLKATVLQALAHHAQDEVEKATQILDEALILAEPNGFARTFVDEGLPMAKLLNQVAASGSISDNYAHRLLALIEAEEHINAAPSPRQSPNRKPSISQPLIEPLSQRELDVLHLIAQGLSNREICEHLFLALSTVKGYNRNIFGKLNVQRRTEAVARARELGLLA